MMLLALTDLYTELYSQCDTPQYAQHTNKTETGVHLASRQREVLLLPTLNVGKLEQNTNVQIQVGF